MIAIKEKIDCCGCSSCVIKCPNNCIEFKEDNEGFKYPKVDKNQCNNCDICISVCPILYNRNHSKTGINELDKLFYACKSKNEEIRNLSSSGGIFSLIAEYVLDNNGIVFGAIFNNDFTVEHSDISNKKDLHKIRGSKYVQSNVNENFKTVEEFLKEDKLVLFSGTPCQISGLKRYLGKEYDNLILIDIVCHGVSSPKVLKKYLDMGKKREKSDIKRVSFRDKKKGWRKYSFTIDFENGNHFSETFSENVYMRAFLRDLYQRPTCHACEFKIDKEESDITLGDYWGIHMFHPDLDDNKGTSFISINSKKGNKIFKEIENNMDYDKTNLEDAIKKNRCIYTTVKPHKNRKTFFRFINQYPIDILINLCLKKKLTLKDHLFLIKEKIKRDLIR